MYIPSTNSISHFFIVECDKFELHFFWLQTVAYQTHGRYHLWLINSTTLTAILIIFFVLVIDTLVSIVRFNDRYQFK